MLCTNIRRSDIAQMCHTNIRLLSQKLASEPSLRFLGMGTWFSGLVAELQVVGQYIYRAQPLNTRSLQHTKTSCLLVHEDTNLESLEALGMIFPSDLLLTFRTRDYGPLSHYAVRRTKSSHLHQISLRNL